MIDVRPLTSGDIAKVPIDNAGPYVSDVKAFSELVDDEAIEVAVVSDGYVYQEVFSPRNDEDTHGLP